MKLTIAPNLALAILTLTGIAESARNPPSASRRTSPYPPTLFHRDLAKRDVNCPSHMAWGNFPEDNAPLLTDCEHLRDTLTGSENFSINVDSETELARYETCAIIVHHQSVDFINVGEEDLFNLLNVSIPAVGRHGHLQVEGQLFCKEADGTTEVGVYFRIDLPEN
ncbi:hypothetical protein QBC34DRAFT_427656 [Podospora aff. communis PSN243]|uniref:Ecp2 effector protein-like domain-containing protein n=1 Tax=Podospora aff. communis PSN243 TaxID=3040156 RepID=A0AAV9GE80_9PEZI|nr:hypothetical protein QBC34DRAFT_427656 [Podospora aff. communis PSN243]